jgi:hypothetical protein
LRTNLVANLNRIEAGPSIFDETRFQNVTLRTNTISLRNRNPEGGDLARLNRALLEDAFPTELARGNTRSRSDTGWLTEGIPDYIRWFIYEPQSHGADMVWMASDKRRALQRNQQWTPHYDAAYRPSANFLNFVTHKYDRQIVRKLNAALREGMYYNDIWIDDTGKPLTELVAEWVAEVNKEVAKIPPPTPSGKG